MLTVALTGGIAAGKSRVARLFEDLGTPCVDADEIAREVVAPGTEGLDAVVEAFGPSIRGDDGGLDRAALRGIIFHDDTARETLEGILHPRIRATMRQHLGRLEQQGYSHAMAVIPLLVETGQQNAYDRILVVDAPEAEQAQRVQGRDGLSREQAESMMARQVGRWQRLRWANDVITNCDPIPATIALAGQVHALERKYRVLAHSAV